jgi:4-carboxymuconolactone decarboxylase
MTNSNHPVSRLAGASESTGDSLLSELYARIRAHRGRVLNIHQVAGHAPKLLRAQAAYAASMREDSSLPRDLQELLILRIAQVNDSTYEQSVHRPIALACGVPQAKIDALPDWGASEAFAESERAALAFIDQAAASGEVDDTVFAALTRSYSPQQVVEIAALTAWYVGNSRFVRALRIAPEAG